jgi:hypothetical protein
MFRKSIHTFVVSSLFLVFMVCPVGVATSAQKDSKSAATKTVTGCLQKGDEADEFSLTSEDGMLYVVCEAHP